MTDVKSGKASKKTEVNYPPANNSVGASARKFIKFNANARDDFLKQLRDGKTKTEAADNIGISRVTIYQYRTAHLEFEEQVREAERWAVEQVEDALYKQAKAGNIRAIEVVLYNRAPERWADKGRHESKPDNLPQGPADPLPAVLQVLDDHPEAKKDLIKRMEMMSE